MHSPCECHRAALDWNGVRRTSRNHPLLSMKLRLEIITQDGTSQRFEHDGPRIRLGRDPEAELALAGNAAHAVSWQHAEIELEALDAFIRDCKSTNGTIVNERRISERTALHVGDVIQLGAGGPVLKVVEMDRSVPRRRGPGESSGVRAQPPPFRARPDDIEATVPVNAADVEELLRGEAPAPPAPPTPWLAYCAAGLAVLALLALVFAMLWKTRRQSSDGQEKKAGVHWHQLLPPGSLPARSATR